MNKSQTAASTAKKAGSSSSQTMKKASLKNNVHNADQLAPPGDSALDFDHRVESTQVEGGVQLELDLAAGPLQQVTIQDTHYRYCV